MDGIKIITHEDFTLSTGEFYGALTLSINEAQRIWSRLGLNCDWLSDPLAFGLAIFPLEIYRKIEELKHGDPSS